MIQQNNEKFFLEEPTIERKKEALEYLNEFVEFDSNINGTGSMDRCLKDWTYEEFLIVNEKRKNRDYAYNNNLCPSKTFFLIRKNDNKIIGMINIRYDISKALLEKGATHIGYSIRPTERNKGYNKIQLYLGLLEQQRIGEKEIIIGCSKDNITSNKSILSLGGILKQTILDKYDNTINNYYFLNVEKSINQNLKKYTKFIDFDNNKCCTFYYFI